MKFIVRAVLLALVVIIGVVASAVRLRSNFKPEPLIAFEPAVVLATLQLDGMVVRGVSANWASQPGAKARYGDPLPVVVTAYCLRGLTRRDRYVREGIVAADPRIFPLARYLEIYVGKKYYGRFLVDDTGKHIKGNRLDIWTSTCRAAKVFGRQRGLAVLVPRPRTSVKDTVLTGRLGGPIKRQPPHKKS